MLKLCDGKLGSPQILKARKIASPLKKLLSNYSRVETCSCRERPRDVSSAILMYNGEKESTCRKLGPTIT